MLGPARTAAVETKIRWLAQRITPFSSTVRIWPKNPDRLLIP
jgi:hypothetical protein